MARTIHLLGAREDDGIILAHCGLRARGLFVTTVLSVVTCRECKRRDPRPRIVRLRPMPSGPAEDPDRELEPVEADQASRRPR